MKHFRFSLTFAILSALACLLVLTSLLLSLISFKTAENDLFAQKNDEARLLISAIVSVLPGPAEKIAGEPSVSRIISGLAGQSSFSGFVLIDSKGVPVLAVPQSAVADRKLAETAVTGREGYAFSKDRLVLHRYAPVLVNGSTVGAARLSLSLAIEQARLKRSRQLFLTYFLLDFLLLLSLGYFILNRIVVAPFRNLLHATERVTAGDYASTVHPPGCAEIAELASSFNTMVAALKTKRQEVEAHVHSLEQANKDIESAREETVRAEKMASVGLLAAGTAHEIGSPLSAIMGFAAILKDELKEDHEKSDYLRRIENEAGRIDRIVRGLLDYARPSKGGVVPIDIGTVVVATVDLLKAQGALKEITVEVEIAENLSPVEVDRHELQQVLINLLLNSRDAMPDGGTIAVKVSTGLRTGNIMPGPDTPVRMMGRRRDDFHHAFLASSQEEIQRHCVIISVSDSGIGIPAEIIPKIFDPFFTTKAPGHGTGLGLAISARIIDSCGGRIIAESAEAGGAAFHVLLPVAAGSRQDQEVQQ